MLGLCWRPFSPAPEHAPLNRSMKAQPNHPASSPRRRVSDLIPFLARFWDPDSISILAGGKAGGAGGKAAAVAASAAAGGDDAAAELGAAAADGEMADTEGSDVEVGGKPLASRGKSNRRLSTLSTKFHSDGTLKQNVKRQGAWGEVRDDEEWGEGWGEEWGEGWGEGWGE